MQHVILRDGIVSRLRESTSGIMPRVFLGETGEFVSSRLVYGLHQ